MENLIHIFKKKYHAVVVCLLFFSVIIADAHQSIDVMRIAGANRYETAISVSQASFDSAHTIIIASGENFPDALVGGTLSTQLKAPILIVPKSTLPQNLKSEILRLNAKRAFILGGEQSVSRQVFDQVKSIVPSIERIAGANRYETASKVNALRTRLAKESGASNVITSGTSVLGTTFHDALIAAPLVGQIQYNEAGGVHQRHLHLVPDNAWVTDGRIVGHAEGSAERYAGKTPYATAAKVANLYESRLGTVIDTAIIVAGTNYPDALTASSLVGIENAVLLLTPTESIADEAIQFLHKEQIRRVYIVGGEQSVSKIVEAQLLDVEKLPTSVVIEEHFVGSTAPVTVAPPSEISFDRNNVQTDFYNTVLLQSKNLVSFYLKGQYSWKNHDAYTNILFRANGINPTLTTENAFHDGNAWVYAYHWTNYYEPNPKTPQIITKQRLQDNDTKLMALAEKAGVGGQSTQLGKAAALNAYHKNTFPYANDGSDHYQMSSIFSLTEYGKGKCAGFAMTLARALNTLGIDAYFAKALLRSTEDHAVVRAFLDGRWYTIEATPSIGMKQTSTANELEKIKSSGFSIVSSEAGLNQVKTVYVNADAEQWLLDNNRRFGY